jgi:hypothetical protein
MNINYGTVTPTGAPNNPFVVGKEWTLTLISMAPFWGALLLGGLVVAVLFRRFWRKL